MRTNLEKYNYYLDILNQRLKEYVNFVIPSQPTKLFKIRDGYSFAIDELTIDNVYYSSGFYKKDKPSKGDIATLINFINKLSFENLLRGNIYLHYTRKGEGYTSSGAYKYVEIGDNKRISLDRESLEPEITRLKELYEPREGYINCAYCHKVVEKEKAVSHKIIYRGRDQYDRACIKEKTNLYCSGQCGGNDQMGHEG